MKALVIAANAVRRLLRDRSNIFFVMIVPMGLILILGITFGGATTPVLGVVDGDGGPLAARVVTALDQADGIEVTLVGDPGELRTAVERGRFQAGLVIPAGYGAAVRDGRAVLDYVARVDQSAEQLGVAVRAVVAREEGALRAARFAAAEGAGSFDRTLAAADALAPRVPRVAVAVTTAGAALFPADLGGFEVGASAQLLLFVFLTSMTAAVGLIETRRLGVSRRMLATPTRVGSILLGEGAGRLAIALLQGLVIMLGSALLFGVNWGDPLAAAALLLAFSLVSAGAALLAGAALRTEQQAVGVGILTGLILGALGGSMMPIEFFSGAMRTIAYFTPHAWANDGFAALIRRDATLVDVLPQIGVLLAYAAVLLLLAVWRQRRTLTA